MAAATSTTTAQEWFVQGQRVPVEVPASPTETMTVHISVHVLMRTPTAGGSGGGSPSNDAEEEGEWITFLHGFPTCSHDFACLLPLLRDPTFLRRYNLLLWDLWGYGDSDKQETLPPFFSVHAQADIQQALWRHFGIAQTHVVSHDLGDTVLQELLARASETGQPQHTTTDQPPPTTTEIGDLFIFNGGIFPRLHRPVLMQRLLLHPWLGPWLSRHAMGYWTFAKGVQGVFSPGHPPGERVLRDMWESVQHRGGARNYHVLIRYILDRFQHQARWEGALDWALFEGTPPGRRRVRFWWGLRDPVSGQHLAAELWRRYGGLFREAGGQGRVGIVEKGELGHWPMLEDPVGAAAAILEFFCRPHGSEAGVRGGAAPASSVERGVAGLGLRAAL